MLKGFYIKIVPSELSQDMLWETMKKYKFKFRALNTSFSQKRHGIYRECGKALWTKKKEIAHIGFLSFLKEKEKAYMRNRLEILSTYDVEDANVLEEKIKKGEVREHPTWEDLITVENLERMIKEVKDDIASLQ